MSDTMGIRSRYGISVKVSLIAMFSVLAFLAALFVRITVSYGAIAYAIVILIGALVLREPYSATIIAFISGLLYSLQSTLFLLILGAFIVRGLVIDLLFLVLGVYKDSEEGRYKVAPITITMVLSSFAAGLYQYLFITLFLGKLVNFGTFIVSTIFIVALISNAIAGFIVSKYVMPRIRAFTWVSS